MSLTDDLDILCRLVTLEKALREAAGVEFALRDTQGPMLRAHKAAVRDLLAQIRIVAARNTGDPPP